MKRYKSVEEFLSGVGEWEKELTALRTIALETGLDETVKWGQPTYTHNGKNIIGIGAFKSYVGIWFFQGALLEDSKKKLINAQEDRTKAMRQWRFTNADEITSESSLIKKYISEAVNNQDAGKFIGPDKDKPLDIPAELQQLFDRKSDVKTQFESLSKSKRREYADHIAEAKREDTRIKRLEKIEPMIMQGIGLNDKYRK